MDEFEPETEGFTDDAKLQEDEIVSNGKLFRQLVEHPAWKLFCFACEARIALVEREILTPNDNPLGFVIGERLKGEITGLRLAMTMPPATVAVADDLLAARAKENNDA